MTILTVDASKVPKVCIIEQRVRECYSNSSNINTTYEECLRSQAVFTVVIFIYVTYFYVKYDIKLRRHCKQYIIQINVDFVLKVFRYFLM